MIVFDLDDTLYEERDYVVSGFGAVCRAFDLPYLDRLVELYDSGERDGFGRILSEAGLAMSKEDLIEVFRSHTPAIRPAPGTESLLRRYREAGHPTGLLTDGRSTVQRAKIAALGLADLFDEIVVSEEIGSEKPDERNYLRFVSRFPGRDYVYVGDNPSKDFVTPNRLGWTTVCVLDRGRNVHPQELDGTPDSHLAGYLVREIA